jgi:hypothetical protein
MLNQDKMEKWRVRTVALLLYPEDVTHQKALEKIKQSYDYAYILHDKDCDEDGVIKKAHWHVVLRFKNQQWNSAIAKDLEITPNYIEKCKNFDNALQYLIHYNDSDKFQYSLDEVKGILKSRLKEKINISSKTEGEKVMDLIDYIESSDKKLSVKDLAKYCAENGYWAEFRRSATIFLKILEETNKKYN